MTRLSACGKGRPVSWCGGSMHFSTKQLKLRNYINFHNCRRNFSSPFLIYNGKPALATNQCRMVGLWSTCHQWASDNHHTSTHSNSASSNAVVCGSKSSPRHYFYCNSIVDVRMPTTSASVPHASPSGFMTTLSGGSTRGFHVTSVSVVLVVVRSWVALSTDYSEIPVVMEKVVNSNDW